jgi:hypothetical protein
VQDTSKQKKQVKKVGKSAPKVLKTAGGVTKVIFFSVLDRTCPIVGV